MDLFEMTAPLRARPWFGHVFRLVGFALALWLEIGTELVGYLFTTFLSGLVPSLLCAVLSGLASGYFFVPPLSHPQPGVVESGHHRPRRAARRRGVGLGRPGHHDGMVFAA